MQDGEVPRPRRSFSIRHVSAIHLLVIAYVALMAGFLIVAVAMGFEAQR